MKLVDEQLLTAASLLLDNQTLLPGLSKQFSEASFESSIRGCSMEPAIPGLAQVKVRMLHGDDAQLGDVVYFKSQEGFMIHRVASKVKKGFASNLLITIGDNCLLPDSPVITSQIVGVVFAVKINGQWQPVQPLVYQSFIFRVLRHISLLVIVSVTRLDPEFTSRLVTALHQVKSIVKSIARRTLRQLGLRP
jgi:signal peptidase I